MFGWGRAFKTREHYVFDYKPRYYDERKERLEKIKEKYANNTESESLEDDITPIVFSKNELRKAWTRTKSKSSNRNSTRRLAIIITIIVGIVAYILDFHHLF